MKNKTATPAEKLIRQNLWVQAFLAVNSQIDNTGQFQHSKAVGQADAAVTAFDSKFGIKAG